MSEINEKLLEPEAAALSTLTDPLIVLGYSSAISLKRIADLLSGQQPVNRYGENLTDAIQNSIARGQRGLETP